MGQVVVFFRKTGGDTRVSSENELEDLLRRAAKISHSKQTRLRKLTRMMSRTAAYLRRRF